MISPTPVPVHQPSEAEREGLCSAPFAVILSCDGLLLDTGELNMAAYREAAEALVGDSMTEGEMEDTVGSRAVDYAARIRRRYDIDVSDEDFQRLVSERYRIHAFDRPVRAFQGVGELLEDLRKQRIPYALATSAPMWKVQHNLEEAGVADYFSVIVSGDDVAQGKPGPDAFLIAAQRLGFEPSRCIAIEGSVHGLCGARIAGMTVVCVTNTFPSYRLREADRIVTSIDEVTVEDLGRIMSDRHSAEEVRATESAEQSLPKLRTRTVD
jgi:HAD superfamily hydrolase (TIGR01509 family)